MSAAPALRRGYRLRRDAVRGGSVILAPERVIVLDEHAAAILELVDGRRTVAEIAASLAIRYDASPLTLQADIDGLLRDLRQEGAIL